MSDKKVFVVIPVYNEAKVIKQVIKEIVGEGEYSIVIVNDGSSDHSRDVLKNLEEIHYLEHVINRGQGAALRTGINFALENGADYIVTIDSDGQHNPQDIKRFIETAEGDNEIDVVMGSRFLGYKSNIPLFRQIILHGGKIFNLIFFRIKLSDPQSGYRLFTRKAAKEIEITQDRMAHASEILHEIVKKKFNVKEIPIKIKYTDYSLEKGQEGRGNIAASIKIIKDLLKKFLLK